MNIRLRPKLIVLCLFSSLLPLTLTGFMTARWLSETANESARVRASTILEIKKNRLEHYLARYRTDMESLISGTQALYTQNANRLEAARDRYGKAVQQHFQHWIEETERFAAKEKLAKNLATIDWVFRDGGSTIANERWSSVADGMRPDLIQFQEKQGFENVYLISAKGNVVLSAKPDAMLGKNITQAPFQGSGLDKFLADSLVKSRFQGFAPLTYLDKRVNAWLASPVRKDGEPEGRVIGILAARMASTALTRIPFQQDDGEKTIQLHLIGADRLPYATTAPQAAPSIPSGPGADQRVALSTPAVLSALANQRGVAALKGINGQAVFSAWAPLSLTPLAFPQDPPWAVLAEQPIFQTFANDAKQGSPFYKKQMDQGGYYDFFLIQPDGEVFFSAARQADFGSNLLHGQYAGTNLGKLVRQVLEQKTFGLTDFEPYPPSNNEPAAFMAQPLMQDGTPQMVVALQLPLEILTTLMQHRDGLEQDGDAYLVGPDGRMRSDSIRDPQGHSVLSTFSGGQRVDIAHHSEAVREALSGKSGELIGQSWSGFPVFTAFSPLAFGNNTTWALVTETPMIQGLLPMRTIPMSIQLTALFSLLFCMGIAWLMVSALRRTLFRCVEPLQEMRNGMLPVHSAVGDRTDEFGFVTRQIQEMANHWHQVANRLGESGERVVRTGRDLSGLVHHAIAPPPEAHSLANVELGERATREVAARIQQHLKQVQTLEQLLARINHTILQGRVTMDQALNAAKEIADRATLFAETAQRTNQLSMKAAFEILGEDAKGSSKKSGAVVLEIRKLAERGRIFADEIGELSLGMSYMVENAHTILGGVTSALQESAALTQGMGLADTAHHGQMVHIHNMAQALKGQIQNHTVLLQQLTPMAFELTEQVGVLQKELTFFNQGRVVIHPSVDGEEVVLAQEELALQREVEESA